MKIIGHRGAKGLAPGNTIASFKKALACKADQIEFDVRVTKDLVPVIHHAKNLDDQAITLSEVLEFIQGRVPLYIEVKWGEITAPIVTELKKYKYSYELGSKSQKTLRELHEALPAIPKIVIEPWSGLRAAYRAKQVNTNIISMNQLFLWSGFIKAISRRGYKLYAYPLNNPTKARRWEKYGLAGVVTDFPDRFMKR